MQTTPLQSGRFIATIALALLAASCTPASSARVTAAAGGTVSLGAEVELSVPPGSIAGDTHLQIARLGAVPVGDKAEMIAFGQAYELSPHGTLFDLARPAALSMQLDLGALVAAGLDASTAVLHYLDTKTNRYVAVATKVDPSTGRLTAMLEHFSTYVPLAYAASGGAAPPVVAVQSLLPNPPRAGAAVLVRATVRDTNAGGSLASVTAAITGPSGPINITMQRDTSLNALDSYVALVPAASVNLGAFGYSVTASNNYNLARTTNGAASVTNNIASAISIVAAPATATVTSGFTRTFSFSARDDASPSVAFPIAPDSVDTLADDGQPLGTVGVIATAGVPFTAAHAGAGTLNAHFGNTQVQVPLNVLDGQLDHLEFLDGRNTPLSGPITVKEGSRTTFEVRGWDSNGNVVAVKPSFSSASSIGTIDSKGTLYALDGSGESAITATVGGVSATQYVAVVPRGWATLDQEGQGDGNQPVSTAVDGRGTRYLAIMRGSTRLLVRAYPNNAPAIPNTPVQIPAPIGTTFYTPQLTAAGNVAFLSVTETGSANNRVCGVESIDGGLVWEPLGCIPLVDPNASQGYGQPALVRGVPYIAYIEAGGSWPTPQVFLAHWSGTAFVVDNAASPVDPGMNFDFTNLDLNLVASPSGVLSLAFTEYLFDPTQVSPPNPTIVVKQWIGNKWVAAPSLSSGAGGIRIASGTNSLYAIAPYFPNANASLGGFRLRPGETSWTALGQIDDGTSSSYFLPRFALAVDGETPYAAFFEGGAGGGGTYNVVVKHLGAGGNWVQSFNSNYSSTFFILNEALSIGPDGVPTLAWRTADPNNAVAINLQVLQ